MYKNELIILTHGYTLTPVFSTTCPLVQARNLMEIFSSSLSCTLINRLRFNDSISKMQQLGHFISTSSGLFSIVITSEFCDSCCLFNPLSFLDQENFLKMKIKSYHPLLKFL